MPSVRAQILAAITAKLELVKTDLGWANVIRNPREVVGDDQLNAIVLMDGGDREPDGLTGGVETRWLELSVGWLVAETADDTAEDLLDAGFVAISDALLDPTDIQLGGLAVAIEQGGVTDPLIGRGPTGAKMLAGQAMDFSVQYWTREGDSSAVGP